MTTLFRIRREMMLAGSPWIMTCGEKVTKITEDEAKEVFRMFREFTIPPGTSPTAKLNIDIGPARFKGVDRGQFARLQDYVAMLEESFNARKQ